MNMNNRITTTLQELRRTSRKALSIFITAGYPTIDATPEIVKTIETSGADIIELGIPFSDPLADGPTIQQSSDIALKNGVTLPVVFDIVGQLRKTTTIPIILMGYVNPLLHYGFDRFMREASDRGVDGLIIPDIPVEESQTYRTAALQNNLAPVFLAAPTTSDQRLQDIDTASEGFVYCVSVTGVTGKENGIPENVRAYLQRCRTNIKRNPILVGFGISSGDDARNISSYADGVIVGSALIKRIGGKSKDDYLPAIRAFTAELRQGLDR